MRDLVRHALVHYSIANMARFAIGIGLAVLLALTSLTYSQDVIECSYIFSKLVNCTNLIRSINVPEGKFCSQFGAYNACVVDLPSALPTCLPNNPLLIPFYREKREFLQLMFDSVQDLCTDETAIAAMNSSQWPCAIRAGIDIVRSCYANFTTSNDSAEVCKSAEQPLVCTYDGLVSACNDSTAAIVVVTVQYKQLKNYHCAFDINSIITAPGATSNPINLSTSTATSAADTPAPSSSLPSTSTAPSSSLPSTSTVLHLLEPPATQAKTAIVVILSLTVGVALVLSLICCYRRRVFSRLRAFIAAKPDERDDPLIM